MQLTALRAAADAERYTDKKVSLFLQGFFATLGFNCASGYFRSFGVNASASLAHPDDLRQVVAGFVGPVLFGQRRAVASTDWAVRGPWPRSGALVWREARRLGLCGG